MTQTPLIAMIVIGIGLAFVFGTIANRLKISPIAGYLMAGVAVGPFTPGFIGDPALALQLADIGVILLMFGVGLHFSLKDLLSLRKAVIPAVMAQIAISTALGAVIAWFIGFSFGAGLVFGLALSVASTVVLLRALQNRRLLDTERGRLAMGWLIVQDFITVIALVLIPAFAGLLNPTDSGAGFSGSQLAETLALTFGKFGAFIVFMLVVGRRAIPWILHYVAHTGSRELFRLAVLAIALGVAFGSAELFDVSFALGAFFAGMILAESTLSQQAASETLPLRDAFAVLFFVSVGMLFDPSIVMREPAPVIATFLVIVAGNALVVFAIVAAFRYSLRTALTLAASLSQIGEFSFILAGLGVELKLLPETGRDLILAGALLSILANPLLFVLVDRLGPWLMEHERRRPRPIPAGQAAQAAAPTTPGMPATSLSGHAVLVGYGRVGSLVGEMLQAKGQPLLVIEERQEVVDRLRARGIEAISGNAGQPGLLEAANIAAARWLISAIPNPFENGNLVEHGRV